jgi:outer membrane protein assembly factor BamD (BamD/ComL family)
MTVLYRTLILSLLVFVSVQTPLFSAYVLRNGKLINAKDLATLPVEDHYNLGIAALKSENWEEAVSQFRIVTINFPQSSWGKEGFYFLGVSYFQFGDKDLANQNFTEYLKENSSPKYFEETFTYKLAIADAFKKGEKRHLFGFENLPQWMPDTDLAIATYNEITNSMPNHELAAKAYLSKADLLKKHEEFRESIDNLTAVIRKFPHTEFAASAYAKISNVYLSQARHDAQNPDILALAEINLKKFTQEFPRDPKLKSSEEAIAEMKEIFANALYETGQLYERKKQYKAAVLYYHNAVSQFKETSVATQCKDRLKELQSYVDEMQLPSSP